jgi:regulator of protease activity HflC (stomatin/prohibitin superfamily)
MDGFYGIGLIVILGIFLFSRWVNILNEYERAVTFWLGRLAQSPKGPGLVLIFWPLEKMVKVSLRTVVLDVPPQDIITRDNVSVKVNAVVYFRVVDPARAIVEVENYLYATSQLAQTTLRSVLGQADMDGLLSEREKLNDQLQTIIDHQTDPWGMSTSRARCSGPWRGRPRRSAKNALRSSTRRVSWRRRSSWPRRPRSSPRTR